MDNQDVKKWLKYGGIAGVGLLMMRIGASRLNTALSLFMLLAALMEKARSAQQQAYSSDNTMSRAEAFHVLGLEPGASDEEVKKAHRKLMQHNHPDQGGSEYIASKLNQARDILLK